MLMIRLQRIGKKKQPAYRLIISEKSKDTQAKSLEILGLYNPMVNPKTIELKEDRIKYWISVGAQASNTVHNLLVNAEIISGEKKKSVTISKKRIAKKEKKETADKEEAKKAEKPVEETVKEENPSVDTQGKKEEKKEVEKEEKVEPSAAFVPSSGRGDIPDKKEKEEDKVEKTKED